jgi:thioredoxin 1
MSRQKTKQYAKYNTLAPTESLNNTSNNIESELHITSLHHKKSLLEQHQVVCIYLWGNFCEPCKAIAPKHAELAKQYYNPGKCILMKENVESEFTRDYQITGVPAFIFYKNGQIVRHEDGKILDVIGGDFNKVTSILNKLLYTK